MALLRKLYAGLKLQINEAKSAVASAFGRKFLGYELWVAKGREVKCAVAHKARDNFKPESGNSHVARWARMSQWLKSSDLLLGWKAYFGLAQTPKVWRELDEWLRHRLRAIQLKHWKRPKTIYRELKVLGASEDVAKQVAGNCHRWWRNSAKLLNSVLTIASSTKWDCQDCHDLKLSNRPVRTRMPGGVAGAPPTMEAPYADLFALCPLSDAVPVVSRQVT